MNHITLTGRLTADAVTRYTQDQKPICKFRFAVKRGRTSNDETDFFNCTMFGKLAETANRLNIAKGTKLLIEGQLQNNNYTDRNGNKREETQVIVSNFEFLEKKSEATSRNTEWQETNESEPFDDGDQDQLPF